MGLSDKKIADKKSFRIFHQEHIRLFYQFGWRFVEDGEVVRDIVQEAFVSAWQRWETFESENHIRAFLYTAVRHKCINYLRDRQVEQKNREKLWKLQHEEFCRDIAIENELYDYICKQIDRLPQMQKAVLWLHIDGFSNEEIARQLNISVNTVLTHKQRAKAVLREYLGHSNPLAFLFFLSIF